MFGVAVLQIACTRSSAGQTAEVADGAGAPLGASDGAGTISDRSGAPLLYAPVVLQGTGRRGTDATLQVSAASGQPLGEARVVKYSFGPRTTKLTLSVTAPPGGEEAARFEPADRRGEQVSIAVGGVAVGTLQRVSHKRGILRSTAAYRLELTGDVAEPLRSVLMAAAIRYQALAAEAANAAQRGERSRP